MRGPGKDIAADRAAWHIPIAEMLFAQRKIVGTALRTARLKARVVVRKQLEFHLRD